MFGKLKEKINAQRIGKKAISMLKENTLGYSIGTYEIQDDKIMCYVDSKLLKKHMQEKKGLGRYVLELDGLYGVNGAYADSYSSKPIYYIIEGISFDSYVDIYSYGNAHILFKDCIFQRAIQINYGYDIIFENNKYEHPYPLEDYRVFLMTTRSINHVNNLKFINDNFINSNQNHPVTFGMIIKANNIDIIDTNIEGNNLSLLDIECNNLVIEDSNINCNEINVYSKKIRLWDNTIQANNGFIMDEDTMYMDFDQKTKEKEELESARTNLINTLRNLRDKCNQDIEKEINEGINKLYKKSTKLKKKKMSKFFK